MESPRPTDRTGGARGSEPGSGHSPQVSLSANPEPRPPEAVLVESQRQLSTLMSNLPGMVYRCRNDAGWTMEFVSGGSLSLTGYEPVDLIASRRISYGDLIHPTDRKEVWEMVQDALRRRTSFELEYRITTADGQQKWVSELGRGVFRGREGTVAQPDEGDSTDDVTIEGFITDITERRLAAEALRESEQRLEALFEAAPIGIGMLVDRVFKSVNGRFCRMVGFSEEELIGQSARLIYASDEAYETVGKLKYEQIAQHGVGSIETQFQHRDGHLVDVLLSSAALVPGDLSAGVAFTAADITERKAAERMMACAKEAAESANRAKTEFLANMSHEIRTPMTAVLGYADLLTNPNLTHAERIEFVQVIRKSGQALLSLINDILDLAKIEAGQIPLHTQPCSPVALVEEVLSSLRGRADEKQLRLIFEADVPVSTEVRTDPVRVRQILTNLIGNAIKFTQQGTVIVELSGQARDDAKVRLCVAVHDMGIGIEPEQLRRIFEPFTQVDTSSTRKYGGTGLGLTISRKLARALGGDIEVQSRPNQGSTFRVFFDAEAVKPTGRQDTTSIAARADQQQPRDDLSLHGRVLLAEDIPDLQRLIALTLESVGLEVDIAEDGQQACEKAAQSSREQRPYDVILMDIQMPGMDGYEATQHLRADGWKGTIIALTAHALERDREASLAAGCDDYLPKPLSLRQLAASLAHYLKAHSAGHR